MEVNDIVKNLDTKNMLATSNTSWRDILSRECQVYVFGENYLAKRFDQINYKLCEVKEAKEILVDNLYALLRFKYFHTLTDEVDEKINNIVKSFTSNLKTSILKVSLDKSSECRVIKFLPDGCIAFRNGVYDFVHNCWLFKYSKVVLEKLSNTLYLYTHEYAIMWYLDFDFESLDIDLKKMSLEEFIEFMKEATKVSHNYCFELMYNISHDAQNVFSLKRFQHLCEILGYLTLQSFSEYFVYLVGSGQNGKNSLLDGCFLNKLVPMAASNSLDAIETDKFITGALENRCHNVYLESSAKKQTESRMIKALTGSMYQTIEPKGVNKYSSLINCKFIFSANDKDKLKFEDSTIGFLRRINLFEIFYQWDEYKRFLKKGDYYDTSFSDSLNELKDDKANITAFIYFAMFGQKYCTNNFTTFFKFKTNEWSDVYFEIEDNLKAKLTSFDFKQFLKYLLNSEEDYKTCFYDVQEHVRLYNANVVKDFAVEDIKDLMTMLFNDEQCERFFASNDVYVSMKFLQSYLKSMNQFSNFTTNFKKIYPSADIINLYNNKAYVKVNFSGNRLKVII